MGDTGQSAAPSAATTSLGDMPKVNKGGRPKGSKNAPPKGAAKAAPKAETKQSPPGADASPKHKRTGPTASDVRAAAQQIVGMHIVLAHMAGAPELMMGEDEAVALAQSTLELAAEFNLPVTGKAFVVLGWIGTVGAIYVPRVAAIGSRMEAERRARAAGGRPAGPGEVPPSGASPGPVHEAEWSPVAAGSVNGVEVDDMGQPMATGPRG